MILDNHFVTLSAGYHDFALVLQVTDDIDNLLLGLLNIANLDRSHVLDLLTQHIRRARRHVGEELRRHFLRRRLERQRKIFGIDLAQNHLQGTVIQHNDILEHEHKTFDFFGKFGIVDLEGFDDCLFGRPVDATIL